MIQRGDILDGKYELLKLIGRGGMSKVWLAMDTHINKQWAVKEIDKTSNEYRKTVDETRTLREIEIMKKLDHPSLPRIVDIIDRKDALCIVMDYIEGESLHQILKTRGVPSQETVVSWMLDICDTLSYLHSFDPPIIYRDMKPANVMLTRDQRIKVIDFGIAKDYKEGYEDTQPLGTRGYASPEHFSKHTDVRSDVYTVGTTMYQLLTGKDPSQPPYYMKPLREIDPDLSSGLEKIILKATEKDPDARYQTMTELASAIESYKSLEAEHIEHLEKRERGFRLKCILSALMIIAGIALFTSGLVIAGRTYSALVNTTPATPGAAEAYEKAIALDPSKAEAYEKLLAEYTGDGEFSDKELSSFMRSYESGKESLSRNGKRYSELNYEIGEAILTYYAGQDSSARAKVLQAEPFFAEVGEGDYAQIAANYVFLGEYYRNYILADSSLVVKGASAKELEELLSACEGAVKSLQENSFSGRAKMKAIIYEFVLNMLGSESSSMKAAGIDKSRLTAAVRSIEEDTECSPENVTLAKDVMKDIERSYSPKKEAHHGDS